MASFLEGAGLATQRHPLATHGDCVSAELGGGAGGHVLLLGHMDTVFPVGTAAQRPFRIAGDNAYGPGVADMKAGLVMNAFVARAFAEVAPKVPPIHILFTGDEEVASPASRQITLERATRRARRLQRRAGPPDAATSSTRRKGAFFIDFEVKGVAAHSGVNPYKGASAIDAIARKVVELHQLERSAKAASPPTSAPSAAA